ncbi:MAG: OmpA family protein [Alphaproteobacteria bacterium]
MTLRSRRESPFDSVRAILALAPLALAASCASAPQDHDRHAIFFAPDSADPGPEGRDLARRLAAEIRGGSARTVRIEAHANRMPDGSENLPLARRRADAVADALREAGGAPAAMRRVVLGEAQRSGPLPVEGRRVDIVLER